MNEIWKDINGYEGMYQISNLGNVKSLNYRKTGKEQILKPGKNKDGYLQVVLCKNGEHKKYYVHRLVLQAFKGDIPEGYECNHLSEKKEDNRLDNLNLLTRKENNNWGSRTERAGKAVSKALTNRNDLSKTVLQFDLEGNLINEFPSAREVERSLGFAEGAISKCCSGKYKYAYGFIWKYTEKEKAS